MPTGAKSDVVVAVELEAAADGVGEAGFIVAGEEVLVGVVEGVALTAGVALVSGVEMVAL